MNDNAITTENFTHWLIKMRKALRSNTGMDVPCGDCRACCTSAYFITVHAEEEESLAAIPKEYLSHVPGAPAGTSLLGFDEKGRCPLLQQEMCTVYNSRPWTCRIYDCRLLAATGLIESPDKKDINRQVKRWFFTFDDENDFQNEEAVKKAAGFIVANRDAFPPGYVSPRPIQQAAVALKVFELFLPAGQGATEETKDSLITAVIEGVRKFNA